MGCVQSYFRKAHSAGMSPSSTQGSDKPPLIGNAADEDALLDKDLVIVDANEVKLAQQDVDTEKKPERKKSEGGDTDAAKPEAPAKSPPKTAVRPEDVISAAPVPSVPPKETESGARHARRPSSSTAPVTVVTTAPAAVSPTSAPPPIASFPETPEPAKADKSGATTNPPEFPAKSPASPTSVTAEIKQEASSTAVISAEIPVVSSAEVKLESRPQSPTVTKSPSISEAKPLPPSERNEDNDTKEDVSVSSSLSQATSSPEIKQEVEQEANVEKTEAEIPISPTDVAERTTEPPKTPEEAPVVEADVPGTPASEADIPEPPPVGTPAATPEIPSPSPETGEVAATTPVTPTTVLVTPSADGPASPTMGSPETGEIPTPTVSITVSPAPDRTPTSSDDEETMPVPRRQEPPATKPATDTDSTDEGVSGSPNKAQSEATTASVVGSRQDSRADTPHSVQATAGSELEDSAVEEEVLGAAAAKIQAGYRGYKTRKQLKTGELQSPESENKGQNQSEITTKTNEKEETPEVLDAAATKIQATFRGHQTRQKLKEEIGATSKSESTPDDFKTSQTTITASSTSDNDASLIESAATTIQATFRGYKTRQQLKKELLQEAASEEPTANTAATSELKDKIQEGNAVESKEALLLDGDSSVLESAATTIQATFRGYKTRKEVQKDKDSDNVDASSEADKAKGDDENKGNAESENVEPNISKEEKDNKEGETKQELVKTDSKIENIEPTETKPEKQNEETVAGTKVESENAMDNNVLESAATTIQATFRGFQTRQQLKTEELIDAAKDLPNEAKEAVISKTEENVVSPVVESAATTIQAAFRGHKTRQELKKKEGETTESEPRTQVQGNAPVAPSTVPSTTGHPPNAASEADETALDAAATAIQATFRGYQTRQQFKNETNKEENKTEESARVASEPDETLLNAAATSIQATFRGFKTREQLRNELKRDGGGATPEQGSSTSQSIEQQLAEACEDVAGSSEAPEMEAAATTIQANFRGYKTRQQLRAGEPTSETGESPAETPAATAPLMAEPSAYHERVLDAAASTIQATFRGYQTRQKVGKPGEKKGTAIEENQTPSEPSKATEEACVPPLEDVLKTAPGPLEAPLPRAPTVEASVPPVEDAVAAVASAPPPETAAPAPLALSTQTSLAESLHEASVPPLEDLVEKPASATTRGPASFSNQVSLSDNVPDTETADVPNSVSKPKEGAKVESSSTSEVSTTISEGGNKTEPPAPTSKEHDAKGDSQPTDKSAQQIPPSPSVEPKQENKENSSETKEVVAPNVVNNVPNSSVEAKVEQEDQPKTVPTLAEQADKEFHKMVEGDNNTDTPSIGESATVPEAAQAAIARKNSTDSQVELQEVTKDQLSQESVIDSSKGAKEVKTGVMADEVRETVSVEKEEKKEAVSDVQGISKPSKGPVEEEKVKKIEAQESQSADVPPPTKEEGVVSAQSPTVLSEGWNDDSVQPEVQSNVASEQVVQAVVSSQDTAPTAGLSKDELGSAESLSEPPTAPLSPKERSSPPSEALSSDAALPSPPLSSQTSLSESLPAAASAPPPLLPSASHAAADESPLTSTATPEPPSEDALPPPPGLGGSHSDSEATPVPEAAPAAEDSQASLPPPPPGAAPDSPPDSSSVGACAGDADNSLPPPPDNDNSLTDVSLVTDTASETGDAQAPRSPETGEQKKRSSQVDDLTALQRPQECAELPHQQRGATINENSPDDLAELEEDESVSSSSVDSAATRIQAGVRGFLTRKQVQRMRSTQVPPMGSPAAIAAMGMSLDSAMPRASSAAHAATRSAEVLAEDGEVWDAIKKDLDDVATNAQTNTRAQQARQKLTRAEAVRASSGSSGSGGGSLDQPTLSPGPGSGELHDSLVLPPPPADQ